MPDDLGRMVASGQRRSWSHFSIWSPNESSVSEGLVLSLSCWISLRESDR